MANKLFEQHEAAKKADERRAADYSRTLAETGAKVQTRKSTTEKLHVEHHGKAASEGRKK
jgi:hypothetical protein